MKILLLTTFPLDQELKLENLKGQYHIFTYHLYNFLIKQKNTEVILHPCPPRGNSSRIAQACDISFPEADHVVVIENRGLYYRPEIFYERLRESVNGAICTICCNNGAVGKEDVLFYMIPDGKRNKKHCKLINWACNHELCVPKQENDKLRILVDHNYYGPHKSMISTDKTEEITEDVAKFAKEQKEKQNVVVRRFIKGGIETVDVDNISELEKYAQGDGLNYRDACEEYSKSDVFIVTHRESMGLSVLESAMAGALIVTPKGYIKDKLLRDVNHVSYEGDQIPWDEVLKKIDHQKSRESVLKYNWDNGAKKIYETLVNYEKHKGNDFRFKNKH